MVRAIGVEIGLSGLYWVVVPQLKLLELVASRGEFWRVVVSCGELWHARINGGRADVVDRPVAELQEKGATTNDRWFKGGPRWLEETIHRVARNRLQIDRG